MRSNSCIETFVKTVEDYRIRFQILRTERVPVGRNYFSPFYNVVICMALVVWERRRKA